MPIYLLTLGIFTASMEPATGSIESIVSASAATGGMGSEFDAGHLLRQRRALQRGFLYTPSARHQVATVSPQQMMQQEAFLDRIERHALTWRRPHGPKPRPTLAYDIPITDHPLVDTYIEYFTGRGRWFFQRWLNRSARYIPMMQPILREHGLPEDLVYLAMIESGFVSKAFSSAAASGFWQFIASTGRQYKLRQTTWVDERRDFVRATHAAARYLTQLYKEFNNWPLAWAGYNAGGGRVRRALKRHGVTSYWQLQDKGMLAKETQHYVPKILAAAIVAKNYQHYGFVMDKAEEPLVFETVHFKGAVALGHVAKKAGTNITRLRELNPELLYDVTPPGRSYTLRVPPSTATQVSAWIASVPGHKRTSYRQHRVRSGDTLGAIARRYGSSIRAVSEFNGIRNAKVLRIGKRLLIPTRGSTNRKRRVARRSAAAASKPKPKVAAKVETAKTPVQAAEVAGKPVATHVVSTGDTFWGIAQRYSVSVADLKRWNGKGSNRLGIGEVLRIF